MGLLKGLFKKLKEKKSSKSKEKKSDNKSKNKSSYCTLCSVCAIFIITVTSAYLLKKCYDVLNNSVTVQEDEVCYFLRLYCTKIDYTVPLSVSDGQFYILLYNSVLEDLTLCYGYIDQFIINAVLIDFYLSLYDTTSNILLIFFIVGNIILLLFAFRYVYKWRRKVNEKSKKSKTRKDSKDVQKSEQDSGLRPMSGRSLWRWVPYITFLAFLISIPWEFVRLYQYKMAEKIMHASQGLPEECDWDRMTYLQYMKSVMKWQFSWSTDACFKYYSALHVDPIWHITPLMVMTSVVSKCIVHPFENLSSGLGRAFRLFFSEIPAQWQLAMLALLVLIIIMLCGYRIQFSFFKFEPRTPTPTVIYRKSQPKLKQQKLLALEDSVDSVNDSVELNSTELDSTELDSTELNSSQESRLS